MKSDLDDGSIILQDHWALLHEAKSNLGLAIEHRLREIELIDKLFAIHGPIGPISVEFRHDKMRSLIGLFQRLGMNEDADKMLRLLEEARVRKADQ